MVPRRSWTAKRPPRISGDVSAVTCSGSSEASRSVRGFRIRKRRKVDQAWVPVLTAEIESTSSRKGPAFLSKM